MRKLWKDQSSEILFCVYKTICRPNGRSSKSSRQRDLKFPLHPKEARKSRPERSRSLYLFVMRADLSTSPNDPLPNPADQKENSRPEKRETRDKKLPAIRVTEEELSQIKAKIAASGQGYSTYVRGMLLDGTVGETRQVVTLDTELKRGVTSAWNNLNQIARKLNALDENDYYQTQELLQQSERILAQQEQFFEWMLDQLPEQP